MYGKVFFTVHLDNKRGGSFFGTFELKVGWKPAVC